MRKAHPTKDDKSKTDWISFSTTPSASEETFNTPDSSNSTIHTVTDSGNKIIVREDTKKKVKKFHNKCELSPKMENPPSPYFTTILADFGT